MNILLVIVLTVLALALIFWILSHSGVMHATWDKIVAEERAIKNKMATDAQEAVARVELLAAQAKQHLAMAAAHDSNTEVQQAQLKQEASARVAGQVPGGAEVLAMK